MLFGRRIMFQPVPYVKLVHADLVIFEFNPRIISTWIFVFIRFVLRKRSVGWGHLFSRRGEGRFQNLIRNMLFSMIPEFITYSRRDQKIIQRKYPRRKIRVAFNSTNSRHDFSLPSQMSNCQDIIYTGRLIKEKKLDFLLNCMPDIVQRCEHFGRLHIVGSGPEESYLKTVVEDCQLNGYVTFHGHNSSEPFLKDLYDRSFCSVSPGYVGLMAFQSLAHGRPIIVAPDEPNSPEFHMCNEGENAVFFESEIKSSLSDAIVDTYNKRAYWNELVNQIQADCLESYSIEAMIKPFVEFSRDPGQADDK